jgi:chemotaxis protein CheC
MQSRETAALTELELDALGEISNIAMARAATSLRKLVGKEILLSVPTVEVLPREAAVRIISKAENSNMVAVRQDFDGTFTGRVLLIFPEASSFELVRVVIGRQLTLEDVIELEEDALAETGNIVLNSWVATMANLLRQSLKVSLPIVIHHESQKLFESAGFSTSTVLFLHIRFHISGKNIEGYVAMVMDVQSLDALRQLVATFITAASD